MFITCVGFDGLKPGHTRPLKDSIFKGFVDYNVPDDIKIKNHIHPYSIAKSLAMDMVTWYNTVHRMPFTTGILFTIESLRKRPEFLLNKVAAYLRARDFNEPLVVGPLDSYRNIIHARDCVAAIRTIISQPAENILPTYNICGATSYLVEDLIRNAPWHTCLFQPVR
jgi:GDP-D-mannose dehydratase